VRDRLRLWYFRASTFLDQFKDEAPVCCGTCKPCLGAAATGATGLLISTLRRGDFRPADDDPR